MKCMFICLFFFVFLSSIATGKEVIVSQCYIYDLNGVVLKRFPGQLCIFREDGSRIAINHWAISYIGSSDEVKWIKNGIYHHQFKVDNDMGIIAALGHSYHNILGCKTRFDTVVVLDLLTGKIKKTIDTYDLISSLSNPDSKNSFLIRSRYGHLSEGVVCDTTHVNSVSQIPANKLEKINSVFKKGNWVVNYPWTNFVAIFDKEFKALIWKRKIDFRHSITHDVQITKDGILLIYVNDFPNLKKNEAKYSAIAEIDLSNLSSNGKVTKLKYKGENLYQEVQGGVQQLSGNRKLASIYSDKLGYQLAFLNRDGVIYKKFPVETEGNKNMGLSFQDAKILDLGTFFKNYQGQF